MGTTGDEVKSTFGFTFTTGGLGFNFCLLAIKTAKQATAVCQSTIPREVKLPEAGSDAVEYTERAVFGAELSISLTSVAKV